MNEALRFSRYAQRLLSAHPAYEDEIHAAAQGPWSAVQMRAFLGEIGPEEGKLEARLRELRQRVLLRVLARDLGQSAALDEVMQSMSDLAEIALQTAHRFHRSQLVTQHGEPRGADKDAADKSQDLLVIGMGKLGGRELNVSSDIDLIFAYPTDGETDGPRRLSNLEFFTRLGQRIIRTLSDVTGDGFVFRVDMRLRPWGDGGAVACSFDALEQYFVSHGREWERYAWIKARVVAGGDDASCAALQQLVSPFVYRKYLDYGTIAAVRALHAQIRQEVARREMGNHIKLGPGGIREIEFIAQAFQLIRGGRDSSLRARATMKILRVLGEKRVLSEGAVEELLQAYVFLRRLEHRLQYLDDAQTHQLPASEPDQTLIASSMGFENWAALMAALDQHRAAVTRHFEDVFAEQAADSNESSCVWSANAADDGPSARLSALGFNDIAAALARLESFRKNHRYQTLPNQSQVRVDALVPAFIEAAARTSTPDATLARAIDFLESITRRAAYLALLQESPQALTRVAEILGASTWAATYLSRHPAVLDELLDLRQLHAPPDWSEFALTLRREMAAHDGDTERQMDLMRELHHAQIFRLLAQDVAGLLTVERLADHLSLAADLVLAVALEECWKLVRNRHIASPRIAGIGYGKLGGKELGYASDLDLVFVYDDPHEAAQENYARLVQRMNTWLSSVTAAGTLFDVDLRLRPNGDAGLLANTIAAFRKYQSESAWPWEHQALTRARFVTGDAATGALFEALRRDVLTAPRDLDKLRSEVLAMRQKMLEGHPNKTSLFDIKHDRGGMVDIEFIVQYLVLAHSGNHYELTANLGNIALLHIAGALKLIPTGLATSVADAYRLYRRSQHKLRLSGAAYARVERTEVAEQIDATLALWNAVLPANAT
ncbi:MAG TPA: bifunctional [glutamate--ammonia ligase]-adenylyl-L-tyrosine phosphorylase/[glutamate--ammonia-ligase] adenylyltransferase [Burkholderiales bacterium]|nr:bifunctional [glutamate--ammonia ligase]-adenylyl-L-tyrosine phosphorylase/[glutamate--ammonia-ligase] adenylyltransferase [Burkholderiales bacterium]